MVAGLSELDTTAIPNSGSIARPGTDDRYRNASADAGRSAPADSGRRGQSRAGVVRNAHICHSRCARPEGGPERMGPGGCRWVQRRPGGGGLIGGIWDAGRPIRSPQGLGLEGAGGAKRAVVVDVVEHGRQAHAEHLLADGAQHELREEEPADAGEARVLVGEARTARVRLEPVGDVGRVAVLVADPRVAQQGELACLEDLAVDDPAPARRGLRDKLRGLRDELEPRADRGRETLRSRPLACGGPQRHERRVDHGTPDLRGGMGVVTHDADVTQGTPRAVRGRRGQTFSSC